MNDRELNAIKKYYDEEYYSRDGADSDSTPRLPWHYRTISRRLGPLNGKSVLDVACGQGQWLSYLREQGCAVTGIDLSSTAIEYCQAHIPQGSFVSGPAESLPYDDNSFDLVTCMGSLEHFVDKPRALREMMRVAKPDARFLVLVPNAGFLTRRLGLYHGTNQAHIKEDVLSLRQWQVLIEGSGLTVRSRWRDLHTLSRSWVRLGRSPGARVARAIQALALPLWPLQWQYQVYFWCERLPIASPKPVSK